MKFKHQNLNINNHNTPLKKEEGLISKPIPQNDQNQLVNFLLNEINTLKQRVDQQSLPQFPGNPGFLPS